MSPNLARSIYARLLRHPLAIRRYSGPAGPTRASADFACRGHIKGEGAAALVGDVMQNTYRAIVNAEDLATAGLALPITTADKVMLDGRELAISFVDGATDYVAGALRAYRLRVKG